MKSFKEEKLPRRSNLESLRILAIIMIIFHHIAVHSYFNHIYFIENFLYIKFIQIGGKIGVNIFVLIAGFFLINIEKIKIKKLLKLWSQMVFYALLIYFIFTIFGSIKFNIKTFINTFFPIVNETWWFATVYILLYIISPFLNIVLKNIDKTTYKKMLIFMLVFWCVLPTFKFGGNQYNSLIWFVILYCVSGYTRLYGDNWKISKASCFILSLLITAITYCIVLNSNDSLYGINQLPIFLISFLLFLGFKKTNVKYSSFINKIASTTFGIYLIHDNIHMRLFLWKDFFKVNRFENTNLLIPYSIYIAFIVFFCCAIIDLIRQYIIDKSFPKIITTSKKIVKKRVF